MYLTTSAELRGVAEPSALARPGGARTHRGPTALPRIINIGIIYQLLLYVIMCIIIIIVVILIVNISSIIHIIIIIIIGLIDAVRPVTAQHSIALTMSC